MSIPIIYLLQTNYMNNIISFDTLLEILLAISLSAAAGFRVFVPLLILSSFAVFGYVDLPANFDWIENNQAFVVFAVASVLEIIGYYVPWLDNVLDIAANPAAVVVGTVIAASVAPDFNPIARWTLALVAGGGTAGITKNFLSIFRIGSTAASGGLANPIFSTLELAAAIALSVLAVTVPLLAGVIVITLLAFALTKLGSLLLRLGDKSDISSST